METATDTTPRTLLLPLVLILILSVFLRLPWIGAGLPYFYDEDEAHHFNRVIEMVKEGDLNPHYFLKPSLHFYLRLPVAAASFLWTVKNGQIKRVEDLKTRDAYGLAGYAFTASHPGVVKWNRALSTLFACGVVLLTFLLAKTLLHSYFAALLAAALTAVAPPLVSNSATIGVNTMVAFFCIAALYFAARAQEPDETGNAKREVRLNFLIWSAISAGLAISTKYNAAPILLVPPLLCLLGRSRLLRHWAAALVLPWLIFLASSPFILASLPLFLNHVAYEIWHYGVSGHEGHMVTPGFEHFWSIVSWLSSSALGWLASISALLGLLRFVLKKRLSGLTFLLFPLVYLVLMSQQKAFFDRNLLVLVPCCAILAAVPFASFKPKESWAGGRLLLAFFASVALVLQPGISACRSTRAQANAPESRKAAYAWIVENQQAQLETAVSGKIQFPDFSFTQAGETHLSAKGISVIDGSNVNLAQLYLSGFDRVVLGPERLLTPEEERFLELEREFPGTTARERIVRNPHIRVYRFLDNAALQEQISFEVKRAEQTTPLFKPETRDGRRVWSCATPESIQAGEPFCWLQSRSVLLRLQDLQKALMQGGKWGALRLRFTVMSPWNGQELTLALPGSPQTVRCQASGNFEDIVFTLPAKLLLQQPDLPVRLKIISSPLTQAASPDQRRLGLAVKSISIE